MIGGVIMVLTCIWVYQSLMRAGKDNVTMWVAICGVIFFAVQFFLVDSTVYIMEALKDAPEGYERELTSVGDRKNEGGFQGFFGVLLSLFLELMPPIAGFIAVAFVRTKVILKEALTPANLLSGIKEMFSSIKQSFKTEAK